MSTPIAGFGIATPSSGVAVSAHLLDSLIGQSLDFVFGRIDERVRDFAPHAVEFLVQLA